MSTKPRTIDGMKVIELGPGAEPPPGVPAWAQRCDLVKVPGVSASARPWMIGGGVVGAAAALAVLDFAHWGGDVPKVLLGGSLLTLLQGLWPGSRTVVTPSESGRFLVFSDGLREPPTEREKSVGCIASGLGVLAMLAGISDLLSGNLGSGAMLGLWGWWFYRVGRTGQFESPGVPAATPQFLALADPNTPLPVANPPAFPPDPSVADTDSAPRSGS